MNKYNPVTVSETSPDNAKAFELAHVLHDLISSIPPEYQQVAFSLVHTAAKNPTHKNLTALVDYILPKHEGGAA